MGKFRVPVRLLQGGLALLLAVGITPGVGVAVVPMDDDAKLCRTFKDFPGGNLSSVGMCVMARPEATQPYNPSQISFLKFPSITVAAGIDSFAFWMKVNDDTLTFNETLQAEAWNMVCVGLSAAHVTPTPEEEETTPQAYQPWASLHGRPLDVPLSASVSEWEEDVLVCLGWGWDMYNSFTGSVTGVTLLAGEGETPPNNCSVLLEANELTVPLSDSWITEGPLFVLDEPLQEPCAAPLRTVLLEGPLGYDEFLRMCLSVGGHFLTEEEAATGQVETFNCTSEEYLSWVSSDGVREGGLTARCPVLLVGGGVAQRPCLSELECTLCKVPVGLRYTLFGPQTKFDRYYSLRTLPNGTFDFLGEETSSIQRTVAGWTLRSSLHRKELNQNMWPMGRRPWHSDSPGHAANNLTFTVCNAIQFSSNDGVCLLRSERCDGRTHSLDRSDEIGCGSQRVISKDTYYDTSISPFDRQNQKMFYDIDLTVISKMNTEKDTAKVELSLKLLWMDARLDFVNTKIYKRNYFPCEDIWTPRPNIFAGYDRGPKVYPDANSTDCYLYWSSAPIVALQLDDPLMGKYISQVNITQRLNLILSYPCLLRVSRYPFGRYVCNLTFDFEDFLINMVPQWGSEENGKHLFIPYEGDHDLHDYWLEKVVAELHKKSWNGNYRLTLTLHLAGQSAHHLVKTFLPSSLMFLICYSSFFFPIAGFNERIMVSLTSLLVLVAADSYIKTSYNTLIDVWYVVLIILCSTVVIANAIVNYLRLQKGKPEATLVKKVLLAKKFNLASQVTLLAAFVLLMLIFILFYNDVL